MLPLRFIRLIPLAFLTLLLPVHLSGQQITGKRNIEWTPVQSMRLGDKETDVFHFRHANYKLNTLLPNYYEVLKIENNSGYEVHIQNPVFQEADYELIKGVKNLEDLPSRISVTSRTASLHKEKYLQVSFIPLRRNPASGKVEMLAGFDLALIPSGRPLKSSPALVREYTDRSVLANGYWVKIKVTEDGIHRLSHEQLRNLGINDPANVRVYGNGGGMLSMMNSDPRHDDLVENNIVHRNDHILFYGQSPGEWKYDSLNNFFNNTIHEYSDGTYYFLTSDLGKGNQVQDAQSPAGVVNSTSTSFDALVHHEIEDINLIRSGREWYGEHFDIVTEQSFPFSFPQLDKTTGIRARIETVGRANSQTSMQVSVDGNSIGSLLMAKTEIGSYTRPHAQAASKYFTFSSATDNPEITLRYLKNSPSAEAWLNYITLNARGNLEMADGTLIFRDRLSMGPGNITEFTIQGAGPTTEVWDVTDPLHPQRMQTNLQGSSLKFKTGTEEIREFVAFTPESGYLTPITEGEDVGPTGNQNLHALKNKNYVVVSHPEFIRNARTLAAYRHDHDGLDTAVVTPQQIYNEFSSGSRDVSAIRDFLKMLYDRAGTLDEMPKYVLLYGDGSYDNKGSDVNNTNFIPTYQSLNALSPTASFVTDDFFGLLDDGEGESIGLVDIGIGRFPVSSPEEALNVLNKTLSYDQKDKMGDWRNSICFIGDDEDGNIHMRQADELARYVESNYPNFTIEKIYLDAYTQVSTPSGPRYPDVNEAISQRIEKGALIINYTGHGGSLGLAHERIIRVDDVLSWENSERLPLFMTATCEFSRFDEWEATSAGELVLLNPNGGGIALLTTTRLVYSGPNHALNEHFYEYVFEKDASNRNYRLGDIIRLTKNATGSGINKRNFTLLGDPALKLAYPKHRVRVETVNGTPVTENIDTLKALGKVSVSGFMEDEMGNPLNTYNGIVYPTIFDKANSVTTLNNDDNAPPMTFFLRNRVLYKGKASVTNGKFEFSFIVPKDIAYNFDYGKLSFYATNGLEDANGSFENVVIGGTADSVNNDVVGPALNVFMNDQNFVFGGMTDENPVLLAYVSDSNGINTLGNGIGHDLTAILDGNTNQTIVLNDYYESDTDSYKSGKIRYSFKKLEAGPHSLKVKVWDVYNNSSEQLIDFIVRSEEDLLLDRVLNYPNPFTTHTQFFFEHNQPNAEMDVLIQVFTISGKLVKTIDYQSTGSGYRIGPIDWDGRDDYGSKIGRGVYIYRVKVRTSLGHSAEKFEKLVILN
ncbi:MAG TPA: type IX secretion system sortase PorU [Bacteroides sp.]|nr:type IX secretion system sortase PorU [Bacteroides sp.]